MSTALSTLRNALAQKMRTYGVSGTATGGSTTTVADTGRDEENDYWNHSWVTITSASPATLIGQTRQVSDFATGAGSGTGTLTVLQAFSAAIESGDTYEIHKKLSLTNLNDAINESIRRARGKIFSSSLAELTADSSTTDLPTDYIYAVAREECYGVLLADATDDAEYRRYITSADNWRVRADKLLEYYSRIRPAGHPLPKFRAREG